MEPNVVLGFKGLKWELSHISQKEFLNQSLVENYIPVRSKLEGKEPQSATFAALNCPASQRALRRPPWGEFHCSHGSFCLMTGVGLSWSGETSLNQDSAGTGTGSAMALTPTGFSHTFSVSKGRWKSSVAAKSSAEERTEVLEKRRTHKLSSWRELLWYYRKCCSIISVLLFHTHGQFCVLMAHGEEEQGLEKWGPINTTLNSLPFRALQWAFKLSGLLFWCPFSRSHQILSHNCICSCKIFLAVLFCISTPGTKKFCEPVVKMKRVLALYHTKRQVLIFLCCFENCKHMGI